MGDNGKISLHLSSLSERPIPFPLRQLDGLSPPPCMWVAVRERGASYYLAGWETSCSHCPYSAVTVSTPAARLDEITGLDSAGVD